jgi:protoheme IX farnesyltransferase
MRAYYQISKPGIVFGNAVTAAGGFALASKGEIEGGRLAATLFGIALVVGGSCVFNNYFDRIADRKMKRTENRPLAQGTIPLRRALIFAIFLSLAGMVAIAFATNPLSLLLASIGMWVYLGLYTPIKYHTHHGTLIGSIAGAMPPLVGYCAVTDQLDLGALLLFSLLVFWQMPHFFAIALYRIDEFAAASIPVLPLRKGALVTKIQMLSYILAFVGSSSLLTLLHYTGFTYLFVVLGLSLAWAWLCIQGFHAENDKKWARKMFLFSLQVVLLLSFMFFVDTQ